MEQRISLVTLGVNDVGRAQAFYEQLGWRGQQVQETVFFQAGGLIVVLWGRDKLAADAGLPARAARASAVSPWLTTSALLTRSTVSSPRRRRPVQP